MWYVTCDIGQVRFDNIKISDSLAGNLRTIVETVLKIAVDILFLSVIAMLKPLQWNAVKFLYKQVRDVKIYILCIKTLCQYYKFGD